MDYFIELLNYFINYFFKNEDELYGYFSLTPNIN